MDNHLSFAEEGASASSSVFMSVSEIPVVVLVSPQMGENIGATARAMGNFGLTELRLVTPRDGWPNPSAVATASGADDILDGVKVFETFAQAVADCHFVVATTARQRELQKPTFSPQSVMPSVLEHAHHGRRTAFVFGPERAGLENEVIALCHGIIHVPVNPHFASLNLAQCVLLMAYEWFQQRLSCAPSPVQKSPETKEPPASHGEMSHFLGYLETELAQAGFLFPPHKRESMVRGIQTMFLKGGFSAQEVRTLWGIVRSLTKK